MTYQDLACLGCVASMLSGRWGSNVIGAALRRRCNSNGRLEILFYPLRGWQIAPCIDMLLGHDRLTHCVRSAQCIHVSALFSTLSKVAQVLLIVGLVSPSPTPSRGFNIYRRTDCPEASSTLGTGQSTIFTLRRIAELPRPTPRLL